MNDSPSHLYVLSSVQHKSIISWIESTLYGVDCVCAWILTFGSAEEISKSSKCVLWSYRFTFSVPDNSSKRMTRHTHFKVNVFAHLNANKDWRKLETCLSMRYTMSDSGTPHLQVFYWLTVLLEENQTVEQMEFLCVRVCAWSRAPALCCAFFPSYQRTDSGTFDLIAMHFTFNSWLAQ